MTTLLKNFWNDDAGQGLVEYVLIIALVAIGLIAIITVFRNAIGKIFKTIADTLNTAPTTAYPTS
jgi:Flp pilus assembly pilin Flp